MNEAVHKPARSFRITVVITVVLLVPVALVLRAFDLHIVDHNFLQSQGNARVLRTLTVSAHRGMIVDRNGEPLAVSTPVDTVWADPQKFKATSEQMDRLARALDLNARDMRKTIRDYRHQKKEFVFIKRRINPEIAQQAMNLKIQGLYTKREYRRYYPSAEVAAHLVGFTNVDDIGQEGVELEFNKYLQGHDGSRMVMIDSIGRIIKNVEMIKQPRPGKDLVLSIDRRLQYLAYRELKKAVFEHHAKAGSATILDVQTGEILAMVNQPSFNPNNRDDLKGYLYRNRAVTDTFEPGSTVKPFTIAAALESGLYKPSTIVNTSPGYMMVGSNTIRDDRDYGRINLLQIIQKSSNVGASKIALSINPNLLLKVHEKVGFGELTGSGLPGEASGVLHTPRVWRAIERATVSYGYGLAVTNLQLARAYCVLASGGYLKPVTVQLQSNPVQGRRVIPARYDHEIIKMLRAVVQPGGTGTRAAVPGYSIAGKTGTVRNIGKHGYAPHKYVSVFVGMAPASHPRLVMAVTIYDPKDVYYGGLVAAPVFGATMAGAMRLLDIPPDELPAKPVNFAMLGRQQ
ncbi:MAG: penicillin-binding transpeptidase domain-containing protein [Gammaproteobacteria bacterium]|jgi:cell division protein FtsI (penicillin-binding protein 3)